MYVNKLKLDKISRLPQKIAFETDWGSLKLTAVNNDEISPIIPLVQRSFSNAKASLISSAVTPFESFEMAKLEVTTLKSFCGSTSAKLSTAPKAAASATLPSVTLQSSCG
uniref:Uncharacterized protein n=1 Tax=Parascaris equorum TaxID=6256 RepID=A0A914RCI5_PAREQ